VATPTGGNQGGVEGASLVVIYRTASPILRAVVLYDGGYTFGTANPAMDLHIKGFYDAVPTEVEAALLTQIVGSGDPDFQESLTVGTVTETNRLTGGVQRAWENHQTRLTDLASLGGAADILEVKAEPAGPLSSTDCLCWAAMVFSTPVKDTDGDGLLDVWETSRLPDPMTNFCGSPQMGANPKAKDLFVEVGYLFGADHSHKPDQSVIDKVGGAFAGFPGGES